MHRLFAQTRECHIQVLQFRAQLISVIEVYCLPRTCEEVGTPFFIIFACFSFTLRKMNGLLGWGMYICIPICQT